MTKMAVTPFDPPQSKNRMLYANFMALCFIEPKLLPMKVLHCWNRDFFLPFLASVTLKLTRWPSYTNLTQKFSSDRQTDRHNRNYIPRRFAGGQQLMVEMTGHHNSSSSSSTEIKQRRGISLIIIIIIVHLYSPSNNKIVSNVLDAYSNRTGMF